MKNRTASPVAFRLTSQAINYILPFWILFSAEQTYQSELLPVSITERVATQPGYAHCIYGITGSRVAHEIICWAIVFATKFLLCQITNFIGLNHISFLCVLCL
jgi:hypothetical protein